MSSTKRSRQLKCTSSEEAYAPPTLPTPPLSHQGNLSNSHKRFRGVSENLERYSSELGLKNEDFRSGGPILLPMPYKHAPTAEIFEAIAQNLHSEDSVLRMEIETILDKHNVARPRTTDLNTFCSPFDPETNPHTYIYVRSQKITPDDSWLRAAEEIYQFFQNMGYKDLNVMIVDIIQASPRQSRPVSSDEPYVLEWKKSMRDQFLKAIPPNKDVLTIDILLRGKDDGGYRAGLLQKSMILGRQRYWFVFDMTQTKTGKSIAKNGRMQEQKRSFPFGGH